MWWLLWVAICVFAYLIVGLCVAIFLYVVENGYRNDERVIFDTLAWPAIIVAVIGLSMSMIVRSAGNRILKWKG